LSGLSYMQMKWCSNSWAYTSNCLVIIIFVESLQ
jgi:hypothetical protein